MIVDMRLKGDALLTMRGEDPISHNLTTVEIHNDVWTV